MVVFLLLIALYSSGVLSGGWFALLMSMKVLWVLINLI